MRQHEEYLKAVDSYLANDRAAVDRFLKNVDFDRTEKALIEARMRLKAGRYDQAAEILNDVKPASPLLKGDHAFVRACLLSFESKWEDAACLAHEAAQSFTEIGYERGLFIANYNLSVYYNRLGLEKLSNQYLNIAEKWQRNPNQQGLVLRAKACDASKNLDYTSAIHYLEEALNLIPKMDPVDQTSLEYVAADIYFRAGHSSVSMTLLERLNHSKIVRDKARVRFELTVLRNLISESSHLVEANIPESVQTNQEHTLQWKILESLQNGDLSNAQELWTKLVELIPQKFAENFKTINSSDMKTVFMTAVLYLRKSDPQKNKVQTAINLEGKQKSLVELLMNSEIHLRKEEIIERLWNIKYDPAYDNRFYKLINRIRKEADVKIVVVSNTYRLVS